MIFGEHATIAYEIIGNIIQWTTYVFLVILILAIPYLIVSYLVHRGKPDKTSPELAAINALMAEIEALKNELREKDSKRTKKKGNMNNYDDM